jgi:GDP-4-dehydro-6-deoxy-D-mannose reductase
VLRAGNLEVTRDFLDVRDVARAYVTLMNRGVSGECYNVCSGQPRSLHSVVARLVELSQTGARLVTDPGRLRSVDIPVLVGDPMRLRQLGWWPEVELDETLEALLAEAERAA